MKKISSCLLASILVASSAGVLNADVTEKIIGEDRFDTAAKIADRLGNYNTAVLVNGYSTADGLSASSFAEYKNAPILLTKVNSIPDTTMKRLEKADTVYIIGGTAVVSDGIETELKNMGKTVTRISGTNRTQTSIAIANEIGSYDKAFIVNGFKGDADAMSVAPVAARDKSPIIVTDGKIAPIKKENGIKYYSIGGSAVINNNLNEYYTAERISGNNRYETNKKILDKFYKDSKTLYCTNGATLVDSLAASTLASENGIALVSKNSDRFFMEGKNLIQVGGLNFSLDEDPSDSNAMNTEAYQTEFRKEFYKLLNQHRADNGLYPLEPSAELEELAYLKSKHMAKLGYFSHYYDDSTTEYYKDRWDESNNYGKEMYIWDIHPDVYPDGLFGENIFMMWGKKPATAKDMAKIAFEEWKSSPGHNANMLRDGFDKTGLAVYELDGKIYTTSNFNLVH